MAQGSPDSNPVKMNLSAYLAQQAKIKANEDSNYMATMKDMRAEQDNTGHNWLINPGHYSSNQSVSRNIQIDTVLDKIVIHVDQLSDSYAQIHAQVSKALKDLISNVSTSSSSFATQLLEPYHSRPAGSNAGLQARAVGGRTYFVAGAGLDTDGWNYTDRWAVAFKDNGIKGFTPLKDVSHDASGSFASGDIEFTNAFRKSTTVNIGSGTAADPLGTLTGQAIEVKVTDEQINKAVNEIIADLSKNPLAKDGQLNLIGYSYGSVLQAHVTLALSEKGIKVNNLILVGSPIPTNSPLFEEVSKVTHVIREDIKGDNLSNPSSDLKYDWGALQNLTDDGHHFDLARPGADTDKKIDETVKDIKSKEVE